MNTLEAIEITGGLGNPSKMPGRSYGLPATKCKTGSKLRLVEGSTCSKCYALKGRYVFNNVTNAQQRRLESLNNPGWVQAMALLINRRCKNSKYFRWHDSGDLQSLAHLKMIIQVCELTPEIKHWMPTREYGIVKSYLDSGGKIPDNLCIRLSAHMIDGNPPNFDLPTSTVSRNQRPENSHICPAPTQNNNCGECRACWDTNVTNVDYRLH